jgi:hypothetical protein
MADPELVNELARKAGVSRADAEAVLEALARMAPEPLHAARPSSAADSDSPGGDATAEPRGQVAAPYVPSAGEVEALIATAEQHPLGLEFLREGDLAAVAIMFGTHAFTVHAARQRLAPGERQA